MQVFSNSLTEEKTQGGPVPTQTGSGIATLSRVHKGQSDQRTLYIMKSYFSTLEPLCVSCIKTKYPQYL